jgi:hypothetical protein
MIAILLFLLLLTSPAFAADHTYTVDVDEPTTNADATDLTDLALMRFAPKRADGTAWITPLDVPATAATGGGHHNLQITVSSVSSTIEMGALEVVAIDMGGNESAPVVAPMIADGLAPSSPNNLNVQTSITTTP